MQQHQYLEILLILISKFYCRKKDKEDSDSSFKEIAITNIITIIIQEIMVTAAMTATIVATSASN
ncbi:hypothetical protein [Clostridium sp.]|uniref:hypothetical protein n=1 Tax=Clostridium sp. TaxID=1506 RepID=UPI0026230D9F|nr:hypothetical protein [Clostridium sp.]